MKTKLVLTVILTSFLIFGCLNNEWLLWSDHATDYGQTVPL